MNKTVKVALGITLGLGIFTAGAFSKDTITKATGDWQTEAVNTANSQLGSAGYSKKGRN